jgi:hypothetical protein
VKPLVVVKVSRNTEVGLSELRSAEKFSQRST